MSKTRRFASAVILLGILLGLSPVLATPSKLAVVGNAKNRTQNIDAPLLRLLYLRELSDWPSGLPAKPIARQEGSKAQQIFREKILGMTPEQLVQHWISIKQRTGQRSARPVGNDRNVVLLLKRYPGAFAVLPADIVESDPDLVVLFGLSE